MSNELKNAKSTFAPDALESLAKEFQAFSNRYPNLRLAINIDPSQPSPVWDMVSLDRSHVRFVIVGSQGGIKSLGYLFDTGHAPATPKEAKQEFLAVAKKRGACLGKGGHSLTRWTAAILQEGQNFVESSGAWTWINTDPAFVSGVVIKRLVEAAATQAAPMARAVARRRSIRRRRKQKAPTLPTDRQKEIADAVADHQGNQTSYSQILCLTADSGGAFG